MQLMQESRRNSDLAARLQGEPRKMLLERNEAISAQLLRSTQAKEVAHRKASLQLEVVEIRPAEIIAQQTKTVDWSSVSAFEKKLDQRSEEHTSELQSLMRISYAVFCLKKKKTTKTRT